MSSEYHSLDPRSIQVQRIAGAIFTAIVSVVLLFGGTIAVIAADDIPVWVPPAMLVLWLAGSVLLAWHAYRWPPLEYRHTSYRADGLGLEIRRGVSWRDVIHVPRSRVQHTDVSQGPVERRYGLGTLVIYTAGTVYAKVDLAGLEHGTALRLRDHLLPSGDADAV